MKWNWGSGLVVGMIAFMSFIMYLVITMSTNKKYGHDLVSEDYYAKEIQYQTEIDAENNMKDLSEKITGKRVDEGWQIKFPKDIESSKINGKVFLYRPSNQQLDFELPIILSGTYLLIPDNKLVGGRWNISIAFSYNYKDYLYKEAIVY